MLKRRHSCLASIVIRALVIGIMHFTTAALGLALPATGMERASDQYRAERGYHCAGDVRRGFSSVLPRIERAVLPYQLRAYQDDGNAEYEDGGSEKSTHRPSSFPPSSPPAPSPPVVPQAATTAALLDQPRRGVRILAAVGPLVLTPLRGSPYFFFVRSHGWRRGLSSFAPPGLLSPPLHVSGTGETSDAVTNPALPCTGTPTGRSSSARSFWPNGGLPC
jgi:hypothetical protein